MNVWVYGTPQRYALLTVPDDGWMIPPTVGDLPLLGTPSDLFTIINYVMTQKEIADVFAVRQQTVSRYVNAEAFPLFSEGEWLRLIALYHEARASGARLL